MSRIDLDIKELSPEEASFSFSESELKSIQPYPFHGEIIGQPRAMRAFRMGLSIPGKGYNIFVSGDPGSGRTSAVRHALKSAPLRQGAMRDILCLHNFRKPDHPLIVTMPAGDGQKFSACMQQLSAVIREQIEAHIISPKDPGEKNPAPVLDAARKKADEALQTFPGKKMQSYFSGLTADLEAHIDRFTAAESENSSIRSDPFFQRYLVNILADRKDMNKPPVVFEHNPAAVSLFGFIDTRGENREDAPLPFLTVRSGACIEASGGCLVINADDILKEDHVWDQLKRMLNTGKITLHTVSGSGASHSAGIKPDPIPIDVKVIALGDEDLYDELSEKDPEFHKHFKISAEFDYTLRVTEKNIGKYIGFIQMVIEDEQLHPITEGGIAEILRYGCFLVEQRDYLSTQFSKIADTLRESSYWAEEMGKQKIDGDAVRKALEERTYLSNLTETKIFDQIITGETLVHLDGAKTGMVNALAVLDRGEYSFGIPAVITATVAPGNEGIVNIEHEAGLSGEIHDKGLLILEGYLRKMYARNFPLSMYSGICFEQSYAEIDGDSASSSELYALLSAIGEIPVRQDIAVTGSVNQMGEIQPVGGINEKILGFHALCRRHGLTGNQGVIIPEKNIVNLIPPDSLIDDIRSRKFHIYPVRTIDEGMQILTRRPAGTRNTKGLFPIHTINRAIEDRLKRLYEISRQQN